MIGAMNSPKLIGYLTSAQAEAKTYEMGLLTTWISVLLIPDFPGAAAMRYILVLYFLSFIILDSQRVWSAIAKSWIVLPLPLLGALSVLWSPYPADAAREALLFLSSTLIIIIVASRFTPRQVLRCLLIAGIIGTIYASLFLSTAHLGGPYNSKNYLAFHMLISAIACLATALDKKTSIFLALPLLAIAGLDAYIILLSEAVTNLLLLMGVSAILFVIRFVYLGAARVEGAVIFLLLFALICVMALGLYLANYMDPKAVDNFLGAFGKDSSLTGRTDLWAAAKKVIRANPFIGVGLEGFWQYDTGAAQTLAENDHRAYGTKLGFHNAYLSVAVHLGYLGLTIFICSIIWAAWISINAFLRNPNMVTAAYLGIAAICLASSMTESFLAGYLNVPTSMFFAAGTLYSVWRKPRVIAAVTLEDAPQAPA